MNPNLFCNDDITSGELNTAFGCIPVNDVDLLIGSVLPLMIGIASGIVFIVIIISGFRMFTSQGQPEKVKASKDLLFAGISALILLIFGIFVYRLIGVDILRIPGL